MKTQNIIKKKIEEEFEKTVATGEIFDSENNEISGEIFNFLQTSNTSLTQAISEDIEEKKKEILKDMESLDDTTLKIGTGKIQTLSQVQEYLNKLI